MPAISDEKVEEVRAASDLVDVVSDYVRLKKQGARFVGLCPFHSERTPSFSVDPRENLYHCFGCKAGGDVYRFVMDKEGVAFPDAVRLLADRAGIELPEEDGPSPEATEREAILAALRFAARFYHAQLGTPAGARGRAYLEQRGFTRESAVAFGIGCAPDEWDALSKAAGAAGYSMETLDRAGLSRRRSGGDTYYDVFRDRLMFPILSPVGKVLGFSGRALPGARPMPDGSEPAKYINTSDTPVYKKAEVLYGLKQAKHAIRAAEEAILVEGQADVVSLHQAGVTNVVAASGTALTAHQVRLLKSYARSVVLLYDSDGAGQSAAARGIEAVIEGGLGVSLVSLPDGADPDSFVTQFGAEAFVGYLERERQDFPSFVAAAARRDGLFDTPEGKSEAARRLVELVARVRDPVAHDAYVQRAASVLGLPDATVRQLLRRRRRPQSAGDGYGAPADPDRSTVPARNPTPAPTMRPEEAELLRLMLKEGAPMVEHVLSRMAIEEFSEGPVRATAAGLIAQYESGTIDSGAFQRGEFGEEIQRLVAEVMSNKYTVSARGASRRGVTAERRDAQPLAAATSAMRLLKLDRLDEALAGVNQEIFVAENNGADATELYRRVNALNELRVQIERGGFLEWTAS